PRTGAVSSSKSSARKALRKEPDATGCRTLIPEAIFPSPRPAKSPRTFSVPFFKRLAERGLAFVADEEGDFGGRDPASSNHFDRLMHSPTRQIPSRRFADEFGETVCERRT